MPRSSRISNVLSSYPTYAEAREAIVRLEKAGFPPKEATVMAGDLGFLERVIPGRPRGRTAMQGLAAGAWGGAVAGLVFGVADGTLPSIPTALLTLYGAAIAGILGIFLGLLVHWVTTGRRDLPVIVRLSAGDYRVVVPDDLVVQAQHLMRGPTAEGELRDHQGAPHALSHRS